MAKPFDPTSNVFGATPQHGYPLVEKSGYSYQYNESPTRRLIGYGQYARPFIGDNDGVFVWPGGLENFSLNSSATVAIHKYLGTSHVDATIQHYAEPHLTINGVLEGTPEMMIQNMVALREQLDKRSDGAGKFLYVPGWKNLRKIVVESYSFDFSRENRGGAINYTIQVLVLGSGKPVNDKQFVTPIRVLGIPTKNSKSHRTFTVTASHRTLRAIAKVVYKNGDRWRDLLTINKDAPWLKDWKPGKELPLVYPKGSKKPVKVSY